MDDLNLSVVIAQIINFGIIFFIFKHFLGKKIVKAIEDRRKKLANLEGADDVVKEKIADAETEAKKIMEKARKEALEMQQKAEDLVKKNTEIKLAEADKKAESIIEAANREIEKERKSMMDELKEKVVDLSLAINAKVFDNKDSNKEFITKEANSIKI